MAPTLTPEQEQLRDRVTKFYRSAEPLHQRHELRWNHYYAQWRSYTDWKRQMVSSAPRDKDQGLRSAKRTWGAELFIPLTYAVIETQVPRVLAQRPRMQLFPADRVAVENIQNMKGLLDRQQDQIQYELKLHPSVKDGLMYGLGVSKAFWRTDVVRQNYLAAAGSIGATVTPEMDRAGIQHFVGGREVTCFDDPDVLSVDPFDFYWTPFADSLENCDEVIHRTWRSSRYVVNMIASGQWGKPYAGPDGSVDLPRLSAEDVEGMGGSTKYDEAWGLRKTAAGQTTPTTPRNDLHEVWEYHDGDEVIVVLDRQVPVAAGPNPYWHGQLPFSIYRPTEAPHEFVGISEIEPMESLQEEMNTLRQQRRDRVTLSLQKPFAYYEGLVDPSNFKWGPNQAWPVNGDPNELIKQLQVDSVDGAAFQDASEIQQDIFRSAGLSDQIISGQDQSGSQDTATGAQLVQINLNKRMELKTRRCEVELIARQAFQFVCMNQQKIIKTREMPVPQAPPPGEYGAEQQWQVAELGPDELAGIYRAAVPEGGSTGPANVPQDRQDAQMYNNLFGQNPHIDQRALLVAELEKAGFRNPEALMLPAQPGVPPEVIDTVIANLNARGLDGEGIVTNAVDAAKQENPTEQPPPPQQSVGPPGQEGPNGS